jgi:small subunit ribosomal protein S1
MVDRNLIREFNVNDDELENELGDIFDLDDTESEEWDSFYNRTAQQYDINQIIEGMIIRVEEDEVLVDVGYKSEGIVPISEWGEGDPPVPGNRVEVLLEEVEDTFGLILLSKRKADKIREWDHIIEKYKEGDIVTGKAVRKIKGGLLVNIGVNVFLPASQVDIRRPQDIAEYLDQDLECVILKIDEARRNIVVSRRKLIEDQRAEKQKNLLDMLDQGKVVKGVVKNIADFGAFVDLGGIDGLLHITDMSWGRIDHPSQMVKIDQEVEVMILNVDREKRKIALGLKQKSASPWENVSTKYPVGSKVRGEVVNVMNYGAFVKLEDGIEGLVHISEMSWTKRVNHPSELVSIGQEVDVVVLNVDTNKQEISLGMKQTQVNPWDNISERYPIGARVTGTVRNLTNYGAFIELQEGVDGLLHVSDMSWTRKISHASEMLNKGDKVECEILSVDQERKRIALGLKQLAGDPWETSIPDKYAVGNIVTGRVTKITNFGVFVQLEPELEGLLHISELSDQKINSPEEVVKVGEEIEVRILRLDIADRKIGLSRKLDAPIEESAPSSSAAASGDQGANKPREELKGGMGTGTGPLFGGTAQEG